MIPNLINQTLDFENHDNKKNETLKIYKTTYLNSLEQIIPNHPKIATSNDYEVHFNFLKQNQSNASQSPKS